jgi:hypothetical protein
MFLNLLLKKPWLTLGILMMLTVWMGSTGYINLFNPKLKPTSCKAALVKLERTLPQNWKLSCSDNNMNVEVNELQIKSDEKEFKTALYRQMANYLVELARNSEADILAKVFIIHFKLTHPKMEINAISEGKYIAKLTTLSSPQFIMDHLKQTVQVKETIK